MTTVLAAVTRDGVAGFLNALILVYSLLIIAYVLTQMIFSMGAHPPYARWSNAILGFLHDVCEPYLRIFRRFIPMIGPLDLSPIVALLVLNLLGTLVTQSIAG